MRPSQLRAAGVAVVGWLTSSEAGSTGTRSTGRNLEENLNWPRRPRSPRFGSLSRLLPHPMC